MTGEFSAYECEAEMPCGEVCGRLFGHQDGHRCRGHEGAIGRWFHSDEKEKA